MSKGHTKDSTYDVRFYLKDEFAKAVRKQLAGTPPWELFLNEPGMIALYRILGEHKMSLHNQLDEFEAYVAEHTDIDWAEKYPDEQERVFHAQLTAMTIATLQDEEKREYLGREFTIEISGGNPQFQGAFKGDEADEIIKDLQSIFNSGIYGEGPRKTEKGVRKVYTPPMHPGTTVPHPGSNKGGPK